MIERYISLNLDSFIGEFVDSPPFLPWHFGALSSKFDGARDWSVIFVSKAARLMGLCFRM